MHCTRSGAAGVRVALSQDLSRPSSSADGRVRGRGAAPSHRRHETVTEGERQVSMTPTGVGGAGTGAPERLLTRAHVLRSAAWAAPVTAAGLGYLLLIGPGPAFHPPHSR
jgi:hypothetical protein